MLHRLTIGARLLMAFGLMTLVIAGVSGLSISSTAGARDRMADVVRLKDDQVLSQQFEKRLLEARVTTWMGFATGDSSRFVQTDATVQAAAERLDELASRTLDPKLQATIARLKATLADYNAENQRSRTPRA